MACRPPEPEPLHGRLLSGDGARKARHVATVGGVDAAHVMVNEATTDSEAMYACPVEGCGRRLVINWLRPALTVIDQGDFWARHVGMSDGFHLQTAIQ